MNKKRRKGNSDHMYIKIDNMNIAKISWSQNLKARGLILYIMALF